MVGLVASGFAIATEHTQTLFRRVLNYSEYAPFIVTPAGLILVAWMTRKIFPGSQGSGIPQAIAALQMSEHAARSKLMSFRIAFGKIILTLLGLLSGASIGREGPTVHIGAALMFALGRFAKFPHQYMDRGLILAGGAAGIAAAFNTPLAGILFAIEEMGRSFEERTSGVMLTAVFIAGVTAVAVQGNYTYFGSTSVSHDLSRAMIPVLVCGIGGGLLGGLFSTALIQSSRRVVPIAKRFPYRVAALCGLGIACSGFISGSTAYGTGYDEAKIILTHTGALPDTYPLTKMASTLFSYLSGIPGGIFAPSLATGAGVGAGLANFLPDVPTSMMIILGMVGYFTGVVQTPITAFVIVMEMTDNHDLLLPLMATALVAFATSRLVCPSPIYRELSKQFLPVIPAVKPEPKESSENHADGADEAKNTTGTKA